MRSVSSCQHLVFVMEKIGWFSNIDTTANCLYIYSMLSITLLIIQIKNDTVSKKKYCSLIFFIVIFQFLSSEHHKQILFTSIVSIYLKTWTNKSKQFVWIPL